MSIIYFLILSVFSVKAILFAYAARFSRKKFSRPTFRNSIPSVSIIIPARNEEDSLAYCLDSLLLNDAVSFEIIIVNDRSTDATKEIINSYVSKDSRIKAVHLSDERTGNLRGKPGALHEGIKHARNEIIMMSDADCTFPTTWISTIAERFANPRIGLVASYTLIATKSLFDHLQNMEWLMNHTLASAGVAIGQPLGCFGNNLTIRRTVYDEIGGYAGIPFSVTEDLTLLQTVHKHGWEIEYPCDAQCVVQTQPCRTWDEFMKQQHRWVKGSDGLGWRKFIFALFAGLFWLSLILSGIHADWMIFTSIIGLRIFGDCLLILPPLFRLKKQNSILWIIPGLFFMMVLEMMVGALLFKKDVVWKGQIFKDV